MKDLGKKPSSFSFYSVETPEKEMKGVEPYHSLCVCAHTHTYILIFKFLHFLLTRFFRVGWPAE